MKYFLVIIGIVTTGFLFFFTMQKHSVEIRGEIMNSAQEKMSTALTDSTVNVKIDGRDIILSGIAKTQEEKTNIITAANSVTNIRKVHDYISVFQCPECVIPECPTIVDKIPAVPPGEGEIVDNLATTQEPAEPPAPTEEEPQTPAQEEAKPQETTPQETKQEEATTQAQEYAPSCQAEIDTILSENKITFTNDDSAISDITKDTLDKVAAALKICETAKIITVNGYGDSPSDKTKSQVVSKNRALEVRQYLQKKGVTKQINAIGKGSGQNQIEFIIE